MSFVSGGPKGFAKGSRENSLVPTIYPVRPIWVRIIWNLWETIKDVWATGAGLHQCP